MSKKDSTAQTEPVNNSFVQLLASIRDGEYVNDAGAALQRLVKSVRETVKRGKIVLTVELIPMDDGAATVKTLVRIDEKLPKPERRASILFTCDDGRLSRDNPDQKELPLRALGGGKRAIPEESPVKEKEVARG